MEGCRIARHPSLRFLKILRKPLVFVPLLWYNKLLEIMRFPACSLNILII